jgi:hypothetical protein
LGIELLRLGAFPCRNGYDRLASSGRSWWNWTHAAKTTPFA